MVLVDISLVENKRLAKINRCIQTGEVLPLASSAKAFHLVEPASICSGTNGVIFELSKINDVPLCATATGFCVPYCYHTECGVRKRHV